MSYLKQKLKPLSILMLLALVYASICSAAHSELHNSSFPSMDVQVLASAADQQNSHHHQSQKENSQTGSDEDCCVSVLTTGKSSVDSLLKVVAILASFLILFVFLSLQRSAVKVRLPLRINFALPESLVARKVCLIC